MKLHLLQTLCAQSQACDTVLVAFQSLLSFISPTTITGPSSAPSVIPAVHSYQTADTGVFHVPPSLHIIVDEIYATSTRDDGLTLMPPTLIDFAQIFASDFKELFPKSSAVVSLGSGLSLQGLTDYVFLTFALNSNHTLADGSSTSEGYQLEVSSKGVEISASGAKGAFWGTRTLLQGLILSGGQFPASVIKDQPDWRTRGIMLDIGRQWYPIAFLKEVCAYASWFKMSEFHVHLSDNVNPHGYPDAYARFRLGTDNPAFAGLVPHKSETYTRAEFDDLQRTCARRGITVIPEIESPGHALAITQWKPEIALPEDITLLNITHPDTIPTVKSIWKEFLPWVHSKQVSIGADEYNSDLADDYNYFVNTMSDFIEQESNKTIRIWGTNEPSDKTSVSKKVIQQHWAFSQEDPFALIRAGWRVINSDDVFQYIVIKAPPDGGFPPQLDQARLWNGANIDSGGIWDPHVFDRGNFSNNPSIAEPLLAGAIMAIWNDHGPNASTPLEAFYSMKQGLPVIAAASWQAGSRPNHLTRDQFLAAYHTLAAHAPGQNLGRCIASSGPLVAKYKPSSGSSRDLSGNGYHAQLRNGVLHTPLGSKGHNYTVLISFASSQTSGTLLSSPDTAFGFTAFGGNTTLAFTSYDIVYSLSNYTLPPPASILRKIVLFGTENSTSVYVDGEYAGDFVVEILLDGVTYVQPMAFVAPVQRIDAAGGVLDTFAIWDGLQDISLVTRA